jgi:hypothetical protein
MPEKQRDERDELPEELKRFGAMLSSLVPLPSRVNRDRLLYEAGAAASALSRPMPPLAKRFWPCASAALLVISIGLGTALALRGPPLNRVAFVQRPAVASNTVPPPVEKTASGIVNESPAVNPGDGLNAHNLGADLRAAPILALGNIIETERALHLGMHLVEIPDGAGAGPPPDTRVRPLLDQVLRNSMY